ncbi:type IX secretion system protein PorD [Puia dinghuensis]|uniref:DUF4835 domain-containing protein n=1 Tax=Puia dinghuensis TaxID=1792502 RepID=A0A8J2UII7_9BACT|nr:DUF4835 family protein [Puia dinghuensis]GGB22748.1 DUF4835 domain-containing protein [Puia dinghuensis]
MRKSYLLILVFLDALAPALHAQDLQANVSVVANRIPSTVDHKQFQTLQAALYNFINNRKWSNETFQNNEKILCNFLIDISSSGDNNTYQAILTVQAGRPVYNSSYQSPLINFRDESFAFRYVEYQTLDFNENRVQGSEPFAANLTAEVAYYIYVILGLDFDSFSLRGGDPYFQKALNIVNNAPDSRDISGWKAFDGIRNRYWLIENLTNNKYTLVHDAYYSYFRSGLDQLYDKESDARSGILNALNMLNTINTETPNTMIIQFFFQGKANELSHIFQKVAPDEKARALDLLSRLDVSNANKYKQDLQ